MLERISSCHRTLDGPKTVRVRSVGPRRPGRCPRCTTHLRSPRPRPPPPSPSRSKRTQWRSASREGLGGGGTTETRQMLPRRDRCRLLASARCSQSPSSASAPANHGDRVCVVPPPPSPPRFLLLHADRVDRGGLGGGGRGRGEPVYCRLGSRRNMRTLKRAPQSDSLRTGPRPISPGI